MRRRKKDSLGLYQALLFGTLFYAVIGIGSLPDTTGNLFAQNTALPFRPIGTPSQVDRYRGSGNDQRYALTRPTADDNVPARQTDGGGMVRQVAMQSGGFQLPSGGGAVPANPSNPLLAPNAYTPPPRSLPNSASPPSARSSITPYSASPMADYQPIAPPQLANGGFATMSDCRLVTPASSYTAMSPYGDCGYGVAPMGYAAPSMPPPAQMNATATMPTYLAPLGTAATAPAAPAGSLVTFGQENYPVQVGPGLWGQPVAYVPGQRFRNWLRYLSF